MQSLRFLLPILLFFCTLASAADTVIPDLTREQLDWLGAQIYQNECNARLACLTTWNAGENFPSLGIGHFIWYRQDQQEIFEETFPALLQHFRQEGIALPGWLEANEFEQPWPDRAAFLAATDQAELLALRNLLAATQAEQTAFILQRFRASVPALVAPLPDGERRIIEQRLQDIMDSQPPYGLYALVDYVHFKGTGLNGNENYQGQGWGLLQVLRNMQGNQQAPLPAFVTSATEILEQRVYNAPASRNEQRWLRGWLQRLDTYLGP